MPQPSYIRHDSSFTDRYQKHEDGIPTSTAALITGNIKALELKCLKVYADDYGIIYYGVIDADGTMIQHSHEISEIVAFLTEPANIR